MQLVAVKLYPAADENGGGNRAYSYAAHSIEVHKGNCQTDSNKRAVKAVFDDAEFDFADESDNKYDAFTGGNKNFGADAEKNTEGKDDSAKDAVKPLPKQGIRCYPAQQIHRKIYAVAEGEQCYQLAQQLTPVNLPQQNGLGNNKKQIQDNSYFTYAPGCKHTQNPWYTGNGRST